MTTSNDAVQMTTSSAAVQMTTSNDAVQMTTSSAAVQMTTSNDAVQMTTSSAAVQMTTSSADGQRKQVWRKCDNSRPETVLVHENMMQFHFYLKKVREDCSLYGFRVLFTFLQVVNTPSWLSSHTVFFVC